MTILDDFQQKTLALFKRSIFAKNFYLAGGTALAEFYLKHRRSEDLDFFTQEELPLNSLKRFSVSLQTKLLVTKVEFQHGFGLYTFFFYLRDEKQPHKLDFGQYPFGTIEPLKNFAGLKVESLYDIAVDKAHTISIRPRLRDFIDLYFILNLKKDWELAELLTTGQEKFGIKVDPLQLGENLFQVKELADMPIMIKPVDMEAVKTFFLKEAKNLKTKIFH